MKYIIIIAVTWCAVFIGALWVLPDHIHYIAGPHKGDIYMGGAVGPYGLSFYIATMAVGAACIAVTCLHEHYSESA